MEKMSEFFTARVNGYDEHMIKNVEGCKEAYTRLAQLIPSTCQNILDLGCGTGLELDCIFQALPNVSVVGIDLTQAMLDALKSKYQIQYRNKKITLICDDYFKVEFGIAKFDCVISFQTMHHFSHEKKLRLYEKVYRSLKAEGTYIECDYMVEKQEEEDYYYAENRRIRRELGIPEEEFYHYDTPCTVENQIAMFKQVGFTRVNEVFRKGNTTIIQACR